MSDFRLSVADREAVQKAINDLGEGTAHQYRVRLGLLWVVDCAVAFAWGVVFARLVLS